MARVENYEMVKRFTSEKVSVLHSIIRGLEHGYVTQSWSSAVHNRVIGARSTAIACAA